MPARILKLAAALMFAAMVSPASAQTISQGDVRAAVTSVDTKAIIENARETRNWLNYGLDYAETRFSKLNRVNAKNVDQLGLAWSHNMNSRRGVEATPIVVDGVMYVTASWSVVHALDAVTGNELWVYDPEVPRGYAYKGCCDVVNRGVALYEGKVFVGAYDGFLHAIDAVTGKRVWKVDTIENRKMSYTITGAPRVIDGKVIIGNGGAEFGVRGYVSAYNADDGKMAWRWYSVPGDPSKPFEDPSQETAAKTWDPSAEWWKAGGGRNHLGRYGLRPGTQFALCGHRQRQSLEPPPAQSGWRRQSLSCLHRGSRSWHRRI